MDQVMEFLASNWVYVVLFAMVLVKILNRITEHFSEHKGLVKVCLFLVDLLDIIKVTPAPRFVKDKATGKTIINSVFVILLAFGLVGCAGWQTQIKEGSRELQQCLQGCAIKCGVEAASKAAKEAVCKIPQLDLLK